MDRKKLVKRLIFLIFFILIINFLAGKFYWYSSIWYFDIFMHFLGGFWVGLAYFYFFPFKDKSIDILVFKTLLFVLFVGIGWEIYEIIVNDVVAQNPFDVLDTLSDIFFDLSGGVFATLYFFKKIMVQSKDSPWGNSLKDCP